MAAAKDACRATGDLLGCLWEQRAKLPRAGLVGSTGLTPPPYGNCQGRSATNAVMIGSRQGL